MEPAAFEEQLVATLQQGPMQQQILCHQRTEGTNTGLKLTCQRVYREMEMILNGLKIKSVFVLKPLCVEFLYDYSTFSIILKAQVDWVDIFKILHIMPLM